MEIQIIKRDGTKEPFQSPKIVRVVESAGLTPDKAQILVTNLQNWISNLQRTDVSSLEVRDKVIQELKALDPYAANMFSWYQKTKESR